MGDISVENAELIGLWFQLLATGMYCTSPSSWIGCRIYLSTSPRRLLDLLSTMRGGLPSEHRLG